MSEELISRRKFIAGTATAAAGLAIAGGLPGVAAAQQSSGVPAKWDYETDVVVVGSGAGGSAAAIDAFDAGAKVIILEKMPFVGGSIRRCGGGISGAGTAAQRKLGVDDSPEILFNYLKACWGDFTDVERIRIIADNAAKNVDWVMQDLGGEMPMKISTRGAIDYGLNVCGTQIPAAKALGFKEIPRAHWFSPIPEYAKFMGGEMGKGFQGGYPGGSGLFKPFDDAIQKRKIQTLLETPMEELVVADAATREVLGVKANSKGKTVYVKANRAVFVATGGFRQNLKMLKDYQPHEYRGGNWTVDAFPNFAPVLTLNPSLLKDHEDGSGILAGMAIGAGVTNMALIDTTRFHCNGGLTINNKAQVLDVFGKVIPRLYASGCVTGGTIGPFYPNCGTYVMVAVCFGRIAGKNAAAEKPWVAKA